MGRYKSYLTSVQNEGGGVETSLGQCPKERLFFMSSLTPPLCPIVFLVLFLILKKKNLLLVIGDTLHVTYDM